MSNSLQFERDEGSPFQESDTAAPVQRACAEERRADDFDLIGTVVLAKRGDIAAQSELVRAYRCRIKGHVRSIVRNADDAEDITQVVMSKMIGRLRNLREETVFESWLFKLSRNSAVDHIRRRSRRPHCVGDESFHAIPADNDSERLSELQQEVDLALAQLSATDRMIVVMFIEGHSYKIIAAEVGVTPTCVKRRLYQVRPFLRAKLRQPAN